MDGKEAIVKKILLDAQVAADNLVGDAKRELEGVSERARADAARKADEDKAALMEECNRIIARRLTLARLEARKALLARKQETISAAYEAAKTKLIADKKRYAALMEKMVLSAAEEGDTLIVGREDASVLSAGWFKKLKKKLDVSVEYGGAEGGERGVVLRGKGADKTLTLASIFEELRARTEAETAGLLFGEANDGK